MHHSNKNLIQTFMNIFLCFFLFFGIQTPAISAFELHTRFHIGNLLFDRAGKQVIDSLAGDAFPWGISIIGSRNLDAYAAINMGLVYDPILRYSAYTLFEYNHDYFTIGVGPFFGVFNHKEELLNPGVSTSVRVELPGVIFGTLRTDSTIGSRLVTTGQYIQQKNQIVMGYYIPNAICSITIETSEFILQKNSTLQTEDILNKYTFLVELFQKNVPIQFELSFGYQNLIRRYISSDTDNNGQGIEENKLNSIMLGTGITYRLRTRRPITFFFDLESAVYSFGKAHENNLKLSSEFPGNYLFRSSLGLSYSFDSLE